VGEYDRYNMQRMLTLAANIAGEDLGGVADRVSRVLDNMERPPQGVTVSLRGQVVPMMDMLSGLETGLLLAVIVIFLLLAANFQSFRLSLVVMLTIPSVLAGVAIALRATNTTLNNESLMGAIMAIGVAVASAILLVTFAERDRIEGAHASVAAVEGAASRLRPFLLTSCAMISDGPAGAGGDWGIDRRDIRDVNGFTGDFFDCSAQTEPGKWFSTSRGFRRSRISARGNRGRNVLGSCTIARSDP
jgi:multidrug efflux pump subunit AcrB